MPERTIRVFEVIYHVEDDHPASHGGAAGDGSFIYRTKSERDANLFASGRTYYGKPAVAAPVDVPKRLARRWGVA